jgi:flavin-dependent dehydrogenase
MSTSESCDAIVIGGGPAGSTAGALLAQAGRRVILLEKEKFPRYHIGESLLPYSYFPLQRLGMIERMKASAFPKKFSVQFARPDGRISVQFYFHTHLQHEAAQTWQVWRGQFDQMLLENAREKGVDVREETLVREVLTEAGATVGVQTRAKDGRESAIRAPITIDASGREAMTLNRRGWRVRDPVLNKIAVWTYYRGATRDPGIDEGATTVAFMPEKGWFWYIPLSGDVVSVGVVAERDYLYRDGVTDPEAVFKRELGVQKWVADHVAAGSVCERYRVTNDYSYRSEFCAADGLVLAGDAFNFLDPLFSSGVFLALKSGEMAADAVEAALAAGDTSAARFAAYGEKLCAGIEAMRKLVYAFYDVNFSFARFFKEHPDAKADVTDCLIGHLFRDFDPLFEKIAHFARVPEPLTYGQTVASDSAMTA